MASSLFGGKTYSSAASGDFGDWRDKLETQRGENRILRQKLQSKAEALLILSQELERTRAECKDYRELAIKLQHQQHCQGGAPLIRTEGGSRTFR